VKLLSEQHPSNCERQTIGAAEAMITLGVDGQIYCHDLTPRLIAALEAICPGSQELLTRSRALGDSELKNE
jgi:hypothetical protein